MLLGGDVLERTDCIKHKYEKTDEEGGGDRRRQGGGGGGRLFFILHYSTIGIGLTTRDMHSYVAHGGHVLSGL